MNVGCVEFYHGNTKWQSSQMDTKLTKGGSNFLQAFNKKESKKKDWLMQKRKADMVDKRLDKILARKNIKDVKGEICDELYFRRNKIWFDTIFLEGISFFSIRRNIMFHNKWFERIDIRPRISVHPSWTMQTPPRLTLPTLPAATTTKEVLSRKNLSFVRSSLNSDFVLIVISVNLLMGLMSWGKTIRKTASTRLNNVWFTSEMDFVAMVIDAIFCTKKR